MAMDCTYRLRIPHRAGQLAKVATRISEYGGLIGDVSTIASPATRRSARSRSSCATRSTPRRWPSAWASCRA